MPAPIPGCKDNAIRDQAGDWQAPSKLQREVHESLIIDDNIPKQAGVEACGRGAGIGMGFSGAKLKVGVAQALCHPAIGKIISACFHERIPSRGLRFETSSPRIRDQEKAAIFWRLYEGAEVRFVRGCLRADLDVVELGCSIGVTSSNIRSRLRPDRRLLCVEADRTLLDVTVRNLELNGLVANVQPVHGAIDCDHEGPTVAFSVASVNFGGRVAEALPGDKLSDENAIYQVPAFTLSELLQLYGISDYVLVADIEGSEAGILFRNPDSLRKCRQAIVELHDTHYRGSRITWQELYEAFLGLGFIARAQRGPVCCFERPDSGKVPCPRDQ